MTRETPPRRGLPVPSGRLSRLARFGGLAASVAGGVAAQGARTLAAGQRPRWEDLLLTPGNAARAAEHLSRLRGAAMKVGQLLSLEAGDMLPREMTDILARLRSDAHVMPPRQLKSVLIAAWGKDFLRRFERFDVTPIAAASIGQVHRALTRDGRDLAIKVQYPGVRASIDSDVANVAALARMSGMLPPGLDIGSVLEEARRQLHEEADYAREAAQLTAYGAHLIGSGSFVAPTVAEDLSTPDILAMSYEPGEPLETLESAPQAERDQWAHRLIDLMLDELFRFGLMQTDPNYANYRIDRARDRIVLLDFGATRAVPPERAGQYRALMAAALANDMAAAEATLERIGVLDATTPPAGRAAVLRLAQLGSEPLQTPGPLDLGDKALAARLKDAGMALAEDRDFEPIPPFDVLLTQRKAAGMYLLANRLRARVDIRALMEARLAAL